jgi:parvulin-like peptidyl-prolyl isomerase
MAALMQRYSEDPTSSASGKVLDVTPTSPMVEPFKRLALRLTADEAGLVKSAFGWHIVKRLAPPPPDPLESKAILAREPSTTAVKVKHILLSWDAIDGVTDPRGKTRDRHALEKLVKATLAKLAQGARIESLMERISEDPGSATTGRTYDVQPDDKSLAVPFRDLSLRLKLNEVGVVRTVFGIHIVKRIE